MVNNKTPTSHYLHQWTTLIQINSAILRKEAYVIYMTVKKLSFYLVDSTITLWSNHLPLERFLQKTLNAKVNNWVTELSEYNIKFKFIKG